MQRGENSTDVQLQLVQNICGGFANTKCDDTDLVAVCSKIVSCKHAVAEVSTCLSLEESVARQVMRDYEQSSRTEVVIHQLLIKWKISKENDAGDTWVNLMQCLASLSGSEPLLEDIRKYLHQKDPCRPEAVGAIHCDMTAGKEETSLLSSPTSQRFVSSSPPLSDSTSPSYQQGFSPTCPVALATSPHDRATYEMVTGCSVTQATPAQSGPRVNVVVKKKVRQQEEKFAHLLAFASDRLQALPGVTPDMLRVYVTQLSVGQKESIPQFSDHMAGIISESSFSQMFALLSRIGAWGFLNFYLLKCIADRYGDDEMKREVEAYGSEVDTFKSETKVKDYLRICRSAYGSLPERKPLIVKLEEKWEHYTLADVAEEEGYLAEEFHLEPYIFNLSNGGEGSVMLMWLIPASAIPLIKRAVMENGMKSATNICELIVDDQRFIFKMCLTRTPQSVQSRMNEQQTDQDVKSKCITAGGDPLEQLMKADYTTVYEESIQDPDKFWGELARKCLHWEKPFDKVMDCDMEKGEIKWFTGGRLNVSVNCLDRHVATNPNGIALIWEKNEPKQHEEITYRDLLDMTCRIANVLKKHDIKKGDTVVLYMPAFPLAVASMLACARIGAVHWYAYNAKVLKEKIIDAKAKAVITANQAVIGKKVLNLKENVNDAVPGTGVEVVFVATRVPGVTVAGKPWDVPLEAAMASQPPECPPEPMDSEDKLFIIYTSGTSDAPKGIVHTQAGYLLYIAVTFRCVFNYKPGDVFSCVSDLGWLPGPSYVVYGPLCNGGTSVLFESTATYPDYDRYWEVIERLKITQFFTTPSAFKLLMKAGDDHVQKHDISSLQVIGSAGETLNTSVWEWCHEVVGRKKCIVLDTWWQTETGGVTITPHPGPRGVKPKPGFSMKPFYGVLPTLVDEEGKQLSGNCVSGRLCLKLPLPGMGRDIHGHSQKYKDDYFGKHKGLYFTNDLAHRDAEGDYQILGRLDDVTAIKGVWLDVAGIEDTMNMSDPRVLETFIVTVNPDGSDKVKHAAFVKLKEEVSNEENKPIIEAVKQALRSAVHYPFDLLESIFIIVNKQPKTHSGKIVRLVLKDIAHGYVRTRRGSFRETLQMEDWFENLGITSGLYCLAC